MNNTQTGWQPNKHDVHSFLNQQMLCVVSTIGSEGWPNAATVAFSETPELELIISTNESTRKAKNIAVDNRIAVTITDETTRRTVQVEGYAHRLTLEEFSQYEIRHYEKLPFTRKLKEIPNQAFYKITPAHLKATDISVFPWSVSEVTFED
jgi:pyridoxine/pyridoxamine 5'-phosphate oxidase